MKKKLHLSLITGGPSLERGISLNSARSVLDHLASRQVLIKAFYIDLKKRSFAISPHQLYSNTPSDFDFKLKDMARALSPKEFVTSLKNTDLAFPVMHGNFGEDGIFQTFLEKHQIPFIGSPSFACKRAFDKYKSNQFLKDLGFLTFPVELLKIYQDQNNLQAINSFFQKHNLKRAIVKPASGGSSIGVFSVANPQEAFAKARLIFSKRMDTRAVLEPFIEGKEFTVIILENRFSLPTAILPTEIETDYQNHQLFDFRKKYLPTRQVAYHCPPRFDNLTIEKIQVGAEQLFRAFNMRDFGRFDGWVLPDGQIAFTDFNPISGMEQNSFLFQQSSRVGLSHRAVLEYILENSLRRHKIKFSLNPQPNSPHFLAQSSLQKKNQSTQKTLKGCLKKPVHVLFGGNTSERQVSVMSGTNTWLKLKNSENYEPRPFLLAPDNTVWSLPYHLTLNHTVEEILENCKNAEKDHKRLKELEEKVRLRLGLNLFYSAAFPAEKLPQKMSMEEFVQKSEFIFIGLHGGIGENGQLQKLFKQKKILFNGPCHRISQLCMDKWLTSKTIQKLKLKNLFTIPGKILKTDYFHNFQVKDYKAYFQNLLKELQATSLIVKPRSDGCSSGVVHLFSFRDLEKYIGLIQNRVAFIEKNTFSGQTNRIEMPLKKVADLLFEKYIPTDAIKIKEGKLKHLSKTGLIEITTALIERNGKIHVFNPSITVAENEVLSVEEKFQGGTGINITPPPASIVSDKTLKKAKKILKTLAEKLKIKGYCRIDAFLNIKTGRLFVIEINTLPALTPSTVFYHQGLAEKKPIHPTNLIEELIANKGY